MLVFVFAVLISVSTCTENNLRTEENQTGKETYKYNIKLSDLKTSYSDLSSTCVISGHVTFRSERECNKDMGRSNSVVCLVSPTILYQSNFTSYEGDLTNSLYCSKTYYSIHQTVTEEPKYIGCAVISTTKEIKSFNQVLISHNHDDDDHDDDHNDDDDDDLEEIFGYVFGGIAAFIVCVGIIFAVCCICICKKRHRNTSITAVSMEMPGNNYINSNTIVQGIPVDSNGQVMVYQAQIYQPNGEQPTYACQVSPA